MLELAGTLRQTTVSLVEVPAQGLDDVLLVIGSGALVARVSAGSVISGPGTSVSVGLASLLTSESPVVLSRVYLVLLNVAETLNDVSRYGRGERYKIFSY